MRCFPRSVVLQTLVCLCLLLSVSWHPLCAADVPQHPNIVVVLVDDLRWDELGCMGHPFVRTPHIDRIAREGARFRNAFCSTPLCSPVRACLLTGRYTHNHGILDNINRSEHSHTLKTFPQTLQKAGYQTAYVGKWHMGNDDTARPGFDYWVSMKGQGTSFDPVLNINGERKQFDGHTTDVLNQKANEFLEQNQDKPFCLYIAQKALHPELTQRDDGSITDPSAAKFMPAKRHENLYSDAAIPRRLNVLDDLEGKTALQRKISGLPPLSQKTGTSDDVIRDRLRMLAGIDEGVGMLLDLLEKQGRLDQTVFVFSSDHGYWYGEHGLSVERRLPYEEGIRVPLLVRFPPLVKAGTLVDEFAVSVDLAPTMVDLAHVKSDQKYDGRSLVPLLKGEHPTDWRKSILIEYNSDTVFPRLDRMGYKAVRTPRWKLIQFNELEGMDELYDVQNDPYEFKNVIDQPENEKVVKQLQAELKRLMQ
ncbi:Choline-sulfatase [Gimesia chilikensis]|uniref:Choline-sulfatase n=1 Tax=Gimesia chilikensis TaxID=2605989 RepID=A0A517W9A1_9PLAN|nr:sulfatase [Gimesia chilikensis]QDU01841.1 Choline-sulfatase [Gimesia chilikensis]